MPSPDPSATLLAVVAPEHRERIAGLLARGAHRKAIERLARTGWWDPRAETAGADTAPALRSDGGTLVSLEPSGWEPIDPAEAVDRLADGYFALVVSSTGRVFTADETRQRRILRAPER